ncbi:MAG: PIN domain-containing protein [Bacillota bacterium]|nr:PIN domain-containing protein [Bacillota bacterium]
MKALIDTCVILDAMQTREPFHKAAENILLGSALNKISGCITANSITDIYYIGYRITKDRKKSLDQINKLLVIFEVLDVNAVDCKNASLSEIEDFEGALLVETAVRHDMECIVTRNIKDFKGADIPVYLPDEFLKLVEL